MISMNPINTKRHYIGKTVNDLRDQIAEEYEQTGQTETWWITTPTKPLVDEDKAWHVLRVTHTNGTDQFVLFALETR